MKKNNTLLSVLFFVMILIIALPVSVSATETVPVSSIKLNKTSYMLLPQKKLKLKATVKPANASNKNVTWYSANKKIAKVSSKGKITAIANGTTTIYAKAADQSGVIASCTIYVLKGSTNSDTPEESTPEESNTSVSKSTPSAKAKQLISYLNKYSDTIASETKAGIDWCYQNGGVERIFANAIKNNKRYANCALIATWALHDVGILSGKECIYGLPYGEIHFGGANAEPSIRANCDIIPVNNATIRELVAENKIIAGDICIYNFGSTQHTNIFNGYDVSNGIYHFFDAGRNGQNCVKGSDGKYHFSSLKQTSTSGGNSVSYLIRLK